MIRFLGNGRLSLHALATNATHAGGYVELDTHNLWGLMEEKTTHLALLSIHPGKRPFIIARSTFASAGKWTGHWLGDNFSRWAYLHYNIQGVLQFQLFQLHLLRLLHLLHLILSLQHLFVALNALDVLLANGGRSSPQLLSLTLTLALTLTLRLRRTGTGWETAARTLQRQTVQPGRDAVSCVGYCHDIQRQRTLARRAERLR